MTKLMDIELSPLPDNQSIYQPVYSCGLPFAATEVFSTSILETKKLSEGEDVNVIYELTLDTKDIKFDYIPGDAIGILAKNDETEVDEILSRLGLEDQQYKITLVDNITWKEASKLKHLPKLGTLRNLLLHHVCLRSVPKKLFLKSLINYTTDETEVELLKKICNPKNSKEYTDFIEGLDERKLLALLNTLQSCKPPIGLLLENLTRLQPRYYSIASTSATSENLKIIFSVVQFKNSKGVCSGWLEKLVHEKTSPLQFYFRDSSHFVDIPDEAHVVLVAVGTGIAPYLGFLEQRALKKITDKTILFYGCRYSDRDFIYKDVIESYVDQNIIKLFTAFSREGEKIYVQDKILVTSKDILDKVSELKGYICICGEVKNFVKAIEETLELCMKLYFKDDEVTDRFFRHIKHNGYYRIDTWM